MKDGRNSVKLQGWNEFCEAYWPAMVSWLQSRGVKSTDAHDLVQGLLERLWKSENFADRLAPEEGKLRSFLLRSLRNWQLEVLQRDARQKRGGEADHVPFEESLNGQESEHFYDQSWARATLRRACLSLRADYLRRGNVDFFDCLLPLIDARNPDKARAVAEELGITLNALNVSLKRLRERLAASLREEVAATLFAPSREQIDEELRHLLASFGRLGDLGDLVSSLSLSSQNLISQGIDVRPFDYS